LNTKNKTILQLLQARQKSGTAMAGPAVPPTTALWTLDYAFSLLTVDDDTLASHSTQIIQHE